MTASRDRILRRMKTLLTTASAAALPACGGYGVVDPMPPPPMCREAAMTVKADAAFEAHAPDMLIAVHLEPSQLEGFSYRDTEPVAGGGTTVSHGRLGSSYEIRVRPNAGVRSMTIDLPIACSQGQDAVRVTLSWVSVGEDQPVTVKVGASNE